MGRRDPSSVGFADTFSRKGRRTRIVASYHPQGSELDPGPLIESLVADGWQAALPRASDRESPLTFHAADGPLAPDAFGIPAPSPTTPRLTPDLVIVPVLAFDRSGGRLGQGAGCYDRTIAVLRAAGPVRVIGLAYAEQEVERVPTGEHDQPLDGILTDKSWVEVVRHPA
jgi:5-formyltetrahydrofolate cyclo-ligase